MGAIAVLSAAVASAQTVITWSNSTSDFNLAANWSGGVLGSGVIVSFGATPTVQPVVTANITVAGLRTQGNVSLTANEGATLTLGASGLEHLAPGITTVSVPLTFSAAAANLTNNAALTILAPITNNTTSGLTLRGNGTTTTITGAIGGSGSLIKDGTVTVVLSGTNTYSGPTIVRHGTLEVLAANAIPTASAVSITPTSGRADLRSYANQTLASLSFGGADAAAFGVGQVTLTGSTLTLNGDIQYFGTNGPGTASIYAGTLHLAAGQRGFQIADSANASTELWVGSTIAGSGGILKTGLGTLELAGASSFSGGVDVQAGRLLVSSTGALGVGGLNLASGTALWSNKETEGSLNLNSALTLGTDVTLGTLRKDQALILGGAVTLANAATTLHVQGHDPVMLTGTLTGPAGTALTIDSGGAARRGILVLESATSANINSVLIDHAKLLFASPGALPASSLQANNGYIGIVASDSGVPSVSTVLAKITDKANFKGTLGFDTDPDSLLAPHVFDFSTTPLDLSGFSGPNVDLTLGSTSAAVLRGTITPGGGGYRFGNGGGMLAVQSNLTGSHGVTVNSSASFSDNALAVVFQGNNSFTGNVSVTNSIAVLDAANALPSGRTVTLGDHGYLGVTENYGGTATFGALVGSIVNTASLAPTAVVGLDSAAYVADVLAGFQPSGYRSFSGAIDLSALGPVYFGTASELVVSGLVKAPTANGASGKLSLLAANDSYLTIVSPLLTGNVSQVVVGSNAASARNGRVELFGANTYTGGTTLLGGTLRVGGTWNYGASVPTTSTALGAGALTVPATALNPILDRSFYGETILNNVLHLGRDLQIGVLDLFNEEMDALVHEDHYVADRFVFGGTIANDGANVGSLTIYDNVALNGANTFTGGVTLRQGRLTLGTDTALGVGGTLKIESVDAEEGWLDLALAAGNGARTLSNPVNLAHHYGDLDIAGDGRLTFTGPVTLNASPYLVPHRFAFTLAGAVGGGGTLKVDGYAPVILSGTNTYSGGTQVYGGAAIFTNRNAIPTTGLLSAYSSGYVGLATTDYGAGTLQSVFIDRFNKSDTSGTIGLDSVGTEATNEFNSPIDLTGFASSVRLGSATSAILGAGATLTPQTSNLYRFGGGGGLLEVNTGLTNGGLESGRQLEVDSPLLAPLTLRLGGTNTYGLPLSITASTIAEASAIIFKDNALPASGSLLTLSMGYIGTEDPDFAAGAATQTFLNRFTGETLNGIVGFDSFTGTYAVTGAIDLSGFSHQVYLGTATSAAISGAITIGGQSAYRFAGYKGGQLTISSLLTGAKSVVIAEENTPATVGSPVAEYPLISRVTLTGANDFTGGTTLYGGELLVGHNTALGTGALTVAGSSFWRPEDLALPEYARFGASVSGLTLANGIVLNDDLTVFGGNSFTLNGVISGGGELYKEGSGTLTLGGNNTFSGGIYIAQGNVTFDHASAVGTGALRMGGPLGPSATFNTSATVNGIAGDDSLDTITLASGTTLTVNQTESATYAGRFVSTNGSLVLKGISTTEPRTLRLTGNSTGFTGSTSIAPGMIAIAAANNVFGVAANSVVLNGGQLHVEPDVAVPNPLTLNSGMLAGSGSFTSTTAPAVKTGVTVSPGTYGVGTLTFGALTLQGGGTYAWEVSDPSVNGTWDKIAVTGGVNITATATDRFTFKISGSGPYNLLSISNFDPYLAQSWTVLTAGSAITLTGADSLASRFTFDTSLAGLSTDRFSVSFGAGNTSLLLNFTPIPEPSTYAMLGAGALVILVGVRRRRRS